MHERDDGSYATVCGSMQAARIQAAKAHKLHPARRARVFVRSVRAAGMKVPVYLVVTFARPNVPGDPAALLK